MRPDREFRSRIDAWLVALVVGSAALPLGAAVWLALRGEMRGVLLLGLWGGTMLLVVGVLSFPLRYTLRADRLHIQSGWLDWDVPYATVRAAALSRSPLAAPAWSLHRVKIDLVDGSCILVSPDDRKVFMQELAERCPQLPQPAAGLDASPSPP